VSNIGIGSKAWVFDENSRVYRRDESGRRTSAPIWTGHWRETEVVDETSRSWVLANGKKVPKKGHSSSISFSMEEIIEKGWAIDNRNSIAETVRYLSPELLRQVAALIGHKDRI
jgi:hypothetical protein